MTGIDLPANFGYVAASVVASWAVHHGYMAVKVVQARKKYGVKYPALYATEENCKDERSRNAFNCVQRGHQNSLENVSTFHTLLIVSGLKYPVTSSIAAALYLAGRVLYMNGYATGNPDKRQAGALGYAGLFTLIGCVGKLAFDLLSKK